MIEKIFIDFCDGRNLKDSSRKTYEYSLNKYARFNEMSLEELIDEAETEENEGIRHILLLAEVKVFMLMFSSRSCN